MMYTTIASKCSFGTSLRRARATIEGYVPIGLLIPANENILADSRRFAKRDPPPAIRREPGRDPEAGKQIGYSTAATRWDHRGVRRCCAARTKSSRRDRSPTGPPDKWTGRCAAVVPKFGRYSAAIESKSSDRNGSCAPKEYRPRLRQGTLLDSEYAPNTGDQKNSRASADQ